MLEHAERRLVAFDALITTDQKLPAQQNLAGRPLAILVLPSTSWPQIQRHVSQEAAAATPRDDQRASGNGR